MEREQDIKIRHKKKRNVNQSIILLNRNTENIM